MAQNKLVWQSKLVLLAVLPALAAGVVLQAHWWAVNIPPFAVWAVGLSLLFGIVVYRIRAATSGGAFTGVVISASLMFSTAVFPYRPWHTALVPLLAVFLLADAATRLGRGKKESLGIAERKGGRTAPQVAANLGAAALASLDLTQNWLHGTGWFAATGTAALMLAGIGLAPLAEAAADTVSSEIGQVLGGRPRMITTLRQVEPGTDGAVSAAGTLAGIVAGGMVAAAGTWALRGDWPMLWICWSGGVFGLFFDSLLGATLERHGWLNNDAVNFLSTLSAAAFALALVAILGHPALQVPVIELRP